MKVLIVDDDTELLDTLGYVLRREGYEIITAADGQHALKRWQAEAPDVVLLDGMLPKVDGFEVCRQIRQAGNTPILMLSARQTEDDRVRGLQLGADDYIPKPFGMRELCARIKAVVRRTRANSDPYAPNEVCVGDLALNLQSCQVARGGVPMRITRIEFRILWLLALNAGQVVPHGQLIEYAWGYQDEGNSNLLKTHICHLRRKLQEQRTGDVGIQSMVHVGYRLVTKTAAPIERSQPRLNLLATSMQPTRFLAVSSMD